MPNRDNLYILPKEKLRPLDTVVAFKSPAKKQKHIFKGIQAITMKKDITLFSFRMFTRPFGPESR